MKRDVSRKSEEWKSGSRKQKAEARALWSALVVLLSYQLVYDNGRWAEVTAEKEEGRTENDGHLTAWGQHMGDTLETRCIGAGIHAVYFGKLLIGHLHERDMGAMRPAVYKHRQSFLKK